MFLHLNKAPRYVFESNTYFGALIVTQPSGLGRHDIVGTAVLLAEFGVHDLARGQIFGLRAHSAHFHTFAPFPQLVAAARLDLLQTATEGDAFRGTLAALGGHCRFGGLYLQSELRLRRNGATQQGANEQFLEDRHFPSFQDMVDDISIILCI